MSSLSEAPAISVRDLVYEVEGRRILDGLNLSVQSGEIVGVVGGSGSGKSTLIKCMAGLLAASAGSVRLCDYELVGADEQTLFEVRNEVGFVFQYSALFDSMTVFQNIALAPMRRGGLSREEARQLVRQKLSLVQLEDVSDYYPSELSGGMAKRVGLARALAANPRVLFYDEPTSGLDPPTARSIDRLIIQMREELGVTSVVVSHDVLALVRFADRIALLEKGRIVQIASPADFLASTEPAVRRFVEAEFMNGASVI